MLYKFLNNEEKAIEVNLKSYSEAINYANENNLICLTMDYSRFVQALENKVEKFKNHSKYEWLKEQCEKAIALNSGYGLDSISAYDFLRRIIALPTDYISAWLDGKNQLEWIDEYKTAQ